MARGRASRAGKAFPRGRRHPAPAGGGVVSGDERETRTMEDRLASIEHHWGSFSPLARGFLLRSPGRLTLRRLVDFFSRPDEAVFAHMPVSIGTAHMLAHEYFGISAYENAKALLLCGAFLQQCQSPDTSIEKIAGMPIRDENNPIELPLYFQGVQATKDEISTSCYLKRVLQLKYQKTMGFERHSQNVPGMKYVDLISNDWNGTSKKSNGKHQKGKGDGAEITIVISNKDDGMEYKRYIRTSTTLKSLFKGYADECGASLRALRFSYNGDTLFLSSIGQKTPEGLGMKNMEVVVVSSNHSVNPKSNEHVAPPPKGQLLRQTKTLKSHMAGRKKQGKKLSAPQQYAIISLPKNDAERNKIAHSNLLSKVFEEMQPTLVIIRRRLNELTLDRQSSKVKRSCAREKPAESASAVAFDTSAVGVRAKAGKTNFAVNVGGVENLYKTSKGAAARRCRPRDARSPAATVDLHGCTREEALERLGACLKEWMNTAMYGSYPWVIPATIVCGAGSQILSETVETWIKETKGVANAPKGSALSM